MTSTDEQPRDWTVRLADWIQARWRWLIVAALLLFALNNLVGLVVGGLGLLAFVNGVVGRLLKAQRIARQVQGIVTPPDDSEKNV